MTRATTPAILKAVRVRRTEQFDQERQSFALRFCCEDCAYFDSQQRLCRHGWPDALHRRAYYDANAASRDILFCKEFELC